MPLQILGLMKSGLVHYSIVFCIIIISSQSGFANKEINIIDTDIHVDFRSMHIWRGIATSYSPTIEPTFEINRKNYTTGIWLAQSFDGNYSELDLYLNYNYRDFSFTVYDYYCPPTIQASSEIANYRKNTTKHTLELNFSFNGNKQLPINILLATMVYGDDINSETNKNNYSTYLQFGYSTVIDENTIELFLGLNTFESYYGENFGIVNAGLTASRNLNVHKSLIVPIQASLITNPLANSLFLSFGFTL